MCYINLHMHPPATCTFTMCTCQTTRCAWIRLHCRATWTGCSRSWWKKKVIQQLMVSVELWVPAWSTCCSTVSSTLCIPLHARTYVGFCITSFLILRPTWGSRVLCDEHVCLSVSVHNHIFGTTRPIFTKFFVLVTCSVLLWRRDDNKREFIQRVVINKYRTR